MAATGRRQSRPLCILGCLLWLIHAQALADARDEGERGIAEYRKGNLIEGMRLLESAADGGYAPAQTTLAFILDAAERDDRAFYWYSRAAAARDAGGLFGLGNMYAKGEGTTREPGRAAGLIREAAELGHVEAMRVYAHALEHGLLDLDRQANEALAWYERAAENGDDLARTRLDQALENGELGLADDPDRAAALQGRINRNE